MLSNQWYSKIVVIKTKIRKINVVRWVNKWYTYPTCEFTSSLGRLGMGTQVLREECELVEGFTARIVLTIHRIHSQEINNCSVGL
jgi:hypothetical protein